MRIIRAATREEVVSHYIASELKRFLENAEKEPQLASKFAKALSEPGQPGEGTLHHMSRALLGTWREHCWLHEQFWHHNLLWSLVELAPSEINVMPLGGAADKFHYPNLDDFVKELRVAAQRRQRITGVHDDPNVLLASREEPMLKRIIVINGQYGNRNFKYAIGDGAHRAIILTARGHVPLEAYWGSPSVCGCIR
jgi:hypothetical protein